MSHAVERGLKQKATIWTTTPDGYGGDTFSAPVVANCRWEGKSVLFRGPLDDKERVSRAIVYLDRDVRVGDYLYEGESSAADPTTVQGAFKVERFDKTPDFRTLLVQRKAYL